MRALISALLLLTLPCATAVGEELKVPSGCRQVPQAREAEAVAGGYADRVIHEKTGIEMIFIPSGDFTMGSNDPASAGAMRPARSVTVRAPFYMGKTEVTNAQYRRFLADSGYDGKDDTDGDYDLYLRHFRGKSTMSTEDDYPIVWVSWKNAKAFCDWAGLSIPSEAQWEYACRAGTTTIYHFGNDKTECDTYGWVLSSKEYHTHAVAEKLPNGWGLHDMIGNVWEWTADDYFYGHEGAPADESPRSAGRITKVLKGGCWGSGVAIHVTGSGGRYNGAPTNASGEIGFRVILPVDQTEENEAQ